jgi:hypothetical protein
MSEQNGTQMTTRKRPANNNKDTWAAYWDSQGQPWRTEPEIDEAQYRAFCKTRYLSFQGYQIDSSRCRVVTS